MVNALIAPQELLMWMANVPWPVGVFGRNLMPARPTRNAVTTTAAQGPATLMMNAVATLVT